METGQIDLQRGEWACGIACYSQAHYHRLHSHCNPKKNEKKSVTRKTNSADKNTGEESNIFITPAVPTPKLRAHLYFSGRPKSSAAFPCWDMSNLVI